VLIYALSLVNNKKIMGDYVNPKFYNVISWGTVGAITVLALFFVIAVFFPVGA